MTIELRRSLPRQFADWEGRILVEEGLEGEPVRAWQTCRVVDVSPGGAGVEVLDPDADLHEGDSVVIEIRLHGQVRHASRIDDGTDEALHVGVQFVGLTERSRDYVESMTSLETSW